MKILTPWAFLRHAKEIYGFVRNRDFHISDGGIVLHDSLLIKGEYYIDDDVLPQCNLLTTESIANILDVVYGATAKQAPWYVSLFSQNQTPAAGWTAATYASTYENTSTSEGYDGANRIEFVDAPASGGIISNLASRAQFDVATASTVTFYGAALHVQQVRGNSVSDVLGSAIRFDTARVREDGDAFQIGYQVSITDS